MKKKGCALVTGSSRGIGAATAIALAREGIPVIVNYWQRKQDAEGVLQKIREEECEALLFRADVSKSNEVEEMVKAAQEAFGFVGILVNNAGFSSHFSTETLSEEEWNRAVEVNLTGAFLCSRAVIPGMKKAGWGRIINLCSLRAAIGSAHGAHYSATKAGIIGLTRSLALELGPDHITVNAVAPGYTRTEMNRRILQEKEQEICQTIPLRRIAEPEEIAHLIVFLASEKAGYITGQTIHINGGLYFG